MPSICRSRRVFDTLIGPLDIQNFGQPTDIDKNGKTVIFFTKEVNKLTPRGSGGVVGGFFFERDLFPTANTPELFGCAASNFAEMYLLARAGSERAFQRRALEAKRAGHHARHARPRISAFDQRRPATSTSTTRTTSRTSGSMKGLSHIAEELLYYQGRAARAETEHRRRRRFARIRRRRSTRSTSTRATTSGGSRFSSANRRRRRCMAAMIHSRRAARRGICCAISRTIAARRMATRGCGSRTARRPAITIWPTCSARAT